MRISLINAHMSTTLHGLSLIVRETYTETRNLHGINSPRQNGDGEEMMLTMFGRCKNPLPWGREYKNLIPDEKSSVDISTCSSDNQNRWSCVTGKDAKLPGRRRTK